jgi:O-antigen/teichoic acid export membrane protein
MGFYSLFWTITAQLVRMFSSLYTIPLCLNHLGTERYGCWMTVMSIFLFSGIFDFGYTSYIRNRLNEAYTRKKIRLFYRTLVGGMFQGLLTAVSILILVSLILSFDISNFFVLSSDEIKQEMLTCILYIGLLSAFSTSTGVIDNYFCVTTNLVNYRINESLINIFLMLSLIKAISLNASMPTLAIIVFLQLPLLKLLYLGVFFLKEYSKLKKIKLYLFNDFKKSYKKALSFCLSTSSQTLLLAAPNILLAKFLSLNDVGTISPIFKIMNVPITLIQVASPVFWIKYSTLINNTKQRKTLHFIKKYVLILFFSLSFFSLAFILFGSDIILIWTKGSINVSSYLIIYFCIWTTSSGVALLLNTFLCCHYETKFIFFIQILSLLIFILTSYLGTLYFGVNGFVLSMSISAIVQVVPFYLHLKKIANPINTQLVPLTKT